MGSMDSRITKCITCGKEIESLLGRNRKYCHAPCNAKRAYKARHRKQWRVEKRCEMCNGPFTPSGHSQRFCSYNCQYQNWGKHDGMKERNCKICLGKFMGNGKQRYCSPKCRRRSYYLKYRGKKIADAVEYHRTHKEKAKIWRNKWRKLNPEKVKFHKRNHEYRKNHAIGNHTLQEWEELKAKHGHRCAICGKIEPEIKLTEDHIIPLSRGGTNKIENIQPLCLSCNSSKGNRNFFPAYNARSNN